MAALQQNPTLFSDGSVTHNTPAHLWLGAHAAHHPTRPTDVRDLTATESDCHAKYLLEGPGVTNHMGALEKPFPSSTRMDAEGSLLVARAPYPAHDAMGNEALVCIAKTILKHACPTHQTTGATQ